MYDVLAVIAVQLLSPVWLSATLWTVAYQDFPVLHYLPESAQTHVCWLWCHPGISSSVAPFSSCSQFFPGLMYFPMSRLFAAGSQSIGPSASVFLMNVQDWFFFRMDWFNLLAVQGTFRSLLQHHNSKASVLQCSAFFMVQLSCPYMTTGKTIALTIQTFVGKMISLLFNMLSRFAITFLPRSKHLLISWLRSLSALILEPKKIVTVSLFPHLPWNDGIGFCDLSFLNAEF